MAKISLTSSLSFADAFENFIFYKASQGVTDKTIECYRSHFKSISNYIDIMMLLQENLFVISKLFSANTAPCSKVFHLYI